MSLIEQAAKRLEELRRADADVSVTPGSGSDERAADSMATPTPEAVVLALEGTYQPTAAGQRSAAATDFAAVRAGADSAAEHSTRFEGLGCARLSDAGRR